MSDLLLRKKLLKWQDVFMLIQWDDRLSPVKAQLVYGMKIIIEMTLCFLATTFETQTKMYQRAFKTDFSFIVAVHWRADRVTQG